MSVSNAWFLTDRGPFIAIGAAKIKGIELSFGDSRRKNDYCAKPIPALSKLRNCNKTYFLPHSGTKAFKTAPYARSFLAHVCRCEHNRPPVDTLSINAHSRAASARHVDPVRAHRRNLFVTLPPWLLRRTTARTSRARARLPPALRLQPSWRAPVRLGFIACATAALSCDRTRCLSAWHCGPPRHRADAEHSKLRSSSKQPPHRRRSACGGSLQTRRPVRPRIPALTSQSSSTDATKYFV